MAQRTANQLHAFADSLHNYSVLLDTREIFIHGHVDISSDDRSPDDGVNHKMASTFMKNMRLVQSLPAKTKPIIIHQYSIGGDWWAGMAIFDTIVQCKCPILFICHGIAASMGSIIPQACIYHKNAYRVAMPSSWFLIHNGTTDITQILTMKQARSMREAEEACQNKMMDIYSKACSKGVIFKDYTLSKTKDFIRNKLDEKEDWWLDANNAVKHGFADAVMGDQGYESIEDILNTWE